MNEITKGKVTSSVGPMAMGARRSRWETNLTFGFLYKMVALQTQPTFSCCIAQAFTTALSNGPCVCPPLFDPNSCNHVSPYGTSCKGRSDHLSSHKPSSS